MKQRGNFEFDAKPNSKFGKKNDFTTWFSFLIFAILVGVNVINHMHRTPDPDEQSPDYVAGGHAEDQLAQENADRKFENDLKRLPADSPKLYDLYAEKGYALEERKKYDQAEVFYKKMLAVAPYAYKTYDYTTRGEYEINYANMLQQSNRAPEAVKVLEETVANQTKALGADSWVIIQTQAALAGALDAAHEYKKEEALELEMLRKMETNKEARDRLQISVLENLGDCYAHQGGHKEEAKSAYEKCLALAKPINANIIVTYVEQQLQQLH
jgi:tetratricopeptide (TPR) repeat protein